MNARARLLLVLGLAACSGPPRHETAIEDGTAATYCVGRPSRPRFVPEAGERVHACDFGGWLVCLAEACGVYEVQKDARRERWEYLCRGEYREMTPRFEHFVRDRSGAGQVVCPRRVIAHAQGGQP